jgi:hypothetical protein
MFGGARGWVRARGWLAGAVVAVGLVVCAAAVLLQPAARRFVIARHHKTAPDATTLKLRVTPNKTGKRLVRHTYRVTLRLWVSYTPTGGRFCKQGFYGLHLPR